MKHHPTVLTIAGSDCSGGAGIQADIKTISAQGCYAASVITALTAQNTQGVQAIYPIAAEFVAEQLQSVFSDLTIDAVKIGMIDQVSVVQTIRDFLIKFKPQYIVIDPVMVAKGGCQLVDAEVSHAIARDLFPLATVITPNIPEAEVLTGINITDIETMATAARILAHTTKTNVLLKGGHLMHSEFARHPEHREGFPNRMEIPRYARDDGCCHDECVDILWCEADRHYFFSAERQSTQNLHGTGCTLSSAIAALLISEHSLFDAVAAAKQYLNHAITAGSRYKIGHGHGPVGHFPANML